MMKYNLLIIIFFTLLSCDDIVVDEDLNGKNLHEVIDEFGQPDNDKTIKLTKNTELYEYQSNLYSFYPGLKTTDTVLVRELFWEYNNGTKMVIWLDKKEESWKVIDNLKWSKNVQF